MPVKARPVPVASVYNWTGFYIGGHIGGAWSNASISDPIGGIFLPAGIALAHNGSSFLGGFQLGYNYQTGPWVFGIQGDMSWTAINASVFNPFFGFLLTHSDKVNWLASLSGRIGYAWNTWLLYGKGGVAWVHNTYSTTNPPGYVANGSDTRTGFLIGAGLEYAWARNWTTFIEYNYIDVGTRTETLAANAAPNPLVTSEKQNISLVKLGLNYKF